MKKSIEVNKKDIEDVLAKFRNTNPGTFKVDADSKYASLIEAHFFCIICTEIVTEP